MQSLSARDPANPPYSGQIRPALTSFDDEVCATIARLFAYVGVLMLFAILGLHAWDRLQFVDLAADPLPAPGWSDKVGKSDAYAVVQHPSGGRIDIVRWPNTGEDAAAELEVYRRGATAAEASSDWMTDTANPPLRGAL